MKLSPELEQRILQSPGVVVYGAKPPTAPAVEKETFMVAHARGRAAHEPGRMNKTEEAYADLLDAEKQAGNVLWWAFEPIKLRLADKTFYTPDFLVMVRNGTLECREVKGFWEDDARVKWKVAAETFPLFRFVAVTRKKKVWFEERYR